MFRKGKGHITRAGNVGFASTSTTHSLFDVGYMHICYGSYLTGELCFSVVIWLALMCPNLGTWRNTKSATCYDAWRLFVHQEGMRRISIPDS